MKEIRRHILKKAIDEMPVHRLDEVNFWEKLDDQQEDNTRYGSPVYHLPSYAAPIELWEKLEIELNKKRKTVQLRSVKYLIRIAAVALIVLSIGAVSILIKHIKSIELKEEYVLVNKIIPDSILETQILSIYNQSLCERNPQICNSILFKELDKQRIEVNGELDLMKPMTRNGDPQMMKYYYRLINLRVEIEKKMVKIIMES